MSASTSVYSTPMFWERLWRMSGINFVIFFIIAYLIYGYQPRVGASADALVAFYDGDRTRILIAVVISGLAVLTPIRVARTANRRKRRAEDLAFNLAESVGDLRPDRLARSDSVSCARIASDELIDRRLRFGQPS